MVTGDQIEELTRLIEGVERIKDDFEHDTGQSSYLPHEYHEVFEERIWSLIHFLDQEMDLEGPYAVLIRKLVREQTNYVKGGPKYKAVGKMVKLGKRALEEAREHHRQWGRR